MSLLNDNELLDWLVHNGDIEVIRLPEAGETINFSICNVNAAHRIYIMSKLTPGKCLN